MESVRWPNPLSANLLHRKLPIQTWTFPLAHHVQGEWENNAQQCCCTFPDGFVPTHPWAGLWACFFSQDNCWQRRPFPIRDHYLACHLRLLEALSQQHEATAAAFHGEKTPEKGKGDRANPQLPASGILCGLQTHKLWDHGRTGQWDRTLYLHHLRLPRMWGMIRRPPKIHYHCGEQEVNVLSMWGKNIVLSPPLFRC